MRRSSPTNTPTKSRTDPPMSRPKPNPIRLFHNNPTPHPSRSPTRKVLSTNHTTPDYLKKVVAVFVSIILLLLVRLFIFRDPPPDYGSFFSSRFTNMNHFREATATTEFQWDDVQVTQNVKGMCGHYKCFWKSISNPNEGYLITSQRDGTYNTMKKAYQFAKDVIETKCHAKHLYLDSPQKVKVKASFIQRLNKLTQSDHDAWLDELYPRKTAALRARKKARNIFQGQILVVQKVAVAPTPNLNVGFNDMKKWEQSVNDSLPTFRNEIDIAMNQLEMKLESERKGLQCVMDASDTYWYDLQGLIDTKGGYYHIDFDSQFFQQKTSVADTYAKRHEMIGKFNQIIQRLTDPPPLGVDELPPVEKDDDDEGDDENGDDYDYDHDDEKTTSPDHSYRMKNNIERQQGKFQRSSRY
mmetsp:Transcript_24169/g.27015  ORF Transcript_24169/g.27015 Transcript_24169/m.27015 type:complete len:412 (-) Transcript_24169:19-1254(-)